MATTGGTGEVKLSGADQERMRKLADEVEARFKEMAEVVRRILNPYQQQQATEELGEVRAFFSKEPKITLLDSNGNCIGVYEDPPGICRPCGPND